MDIRTSPGFSTILQFDAKPTSVVLGDQDSFKIEYVGNSLTIKPLREGVKTNLFVFTDYDRFNFRLVSGQSNADYVVKVRRKGVIVPTEQHSKAKSPTVIADLEVNSLRINESSGDVTVAVSSVSHPRSKKAVIIHFSIHSPQPVAAENLTLWQENTQIPFQELRFTGAGNGIFVVRTSNFNPSQPLTFRCALSSGHLDVAIPLKSNKE